MRYAGIYKFDISNGPGIRVSLFVQGCHFHCKGCFNSEAWDFDGGNEFTTDIANDILKLAEPDWVSGISILGGEPLAPQNRETVAKFCEGFKKKFPNKTIWLWTGYKFEELPKISLTYNPIIKIKSLVDVIIDGRFEEDKKDLSLEWRGSSNQRIWKKDNSNKWYYVL